MAGRWIAASQYLQKAAVEHLLGIASTAMPTMYLGYTTSDPGESGSLSGEPAGGGYGRQEVTSKFSAFNLSTGVAQNTAGIQHAQPTGAQGTITQIVYADSITPGAGNVLFYGHLDTPLVVDAGSPPVSFAPGQLKIELSNINITNYARKAIGDHLIGKAAMTMPAACKYHLFKQSPTGAGLFTHEADYTDYVAFDDLTSKMAAVILSGAGAGISYSDDEVAFPAPGSSQVLPYVGISDGEVSPALLFQAPLRHAIVVNAGGAAPTFPAGSIAIGMS